ncbi:MurR/RpiR family transcriptional regulator [Priestia endophytica]|uniref:MurR/RpiR family transcriptional regulator n=1 Tax=Priestia endophytica TaxID=135735 RepID=UPI000DCA931E|nr:MurR/RpiR family transcriptional regulator [Priestia endophytica]RAS80073.1 RpiR family transcriptional regulator [Priestia endophytica]
MFSSEMISSFNELETALYNYICKNGEKVVYMRIRDLANETHVSTSTILRFCRKINCEGFSEFKVKLKLHLNQSQEVKVKSSQYALSEFVERIESFQEGIKRAVDLITSCDNVIFIGTGSSGILAEYGARYFSSIGKLSMYVKDPYMPIQANFLHNSTTIALSVSGETSFTVSHIHQLKESGSHIVSITNNKHCTMSKMADVNISYYVNEEWINGANITTQMPVVYLLEEMAREVHRVSTRGEN